MKILIKVFSGLAVILTLTGSLYVFRDIVSAPKIDPALIIFFILGLMVLPPLAYEYYGGNTKLSKVLLRFFVWNLALIGMGVVFALFGFFQGVF